MFLYFFFFYINCLVALVRVKNSIWNPPLFPLLFAIYLVGHQQPTASIPSQHVWIVFGEWKLTADQTNMHQAGMVAIQVQMWTLMMQRNKQRINSFRFWIGFRLVDSQNLWSGIFGESSDWLICHFLPITCWLWIVYVQLGWSPKTRWLTVCPLCRYSIGGGHWKTNSFAHQNMASFSIHTVCVRVSKRIRFWQAFKHWGLGVNARKWWQHQR